MPGLAAGVGATIVWAGWVGARTGVHIPAGADVVLLVSAFAAGWGAFVAPIPSLAAIAIVVVLRIRTGWDASSHHALELVTLGIAGIALAWTAVPLLL